MLHDNRIDRWTSSKARLFSVFCAFFLLFGAAAPVVAQDDGRDAETTKKVLQLIREGNKQYDDEKYEAAYESYTQAYDLYSDPAILVRLGKTAEKLGEKRAAVNYYTKYIAVNPEDQTAKQLEKRLPELKKGLKPLIKIASTPDGATVYIGEVSDENKVGQTPVEVEPVPGKITIIVTKEGYRDATRTPEVSEGTTTELSVELEEAPDTEPRADAGEDAPLVEDPGASQGTSQQREADTTDLSVWGWGTAGVGVALIGTGAAFAIMSQSRESDVNNYDKRAPGANSSDLEALKSESESYYNTSVGLFVAGGVVAATGVGILTYHFLTAEERQESAVRFNGGVMSDGGWVGLSGRF
ncbi:MAG: PEGA domain-containing protein [Myxococcota bacterium]